jgi:hypothetical protein
MGWPFRKKTFIDAAVEHVRKAIFIGPARTEAFNLLGALMEIRGDRLEAPKNCHVALFLDPSYAPAIKNLDRATSRGWKQAQGIILEEKKEGSNKP